MNAQHLKPYPELIAALEAVNLQGKSALITGGGQGIGPFIARAFAERNISGIILVGRTESKLKTTAKDLSSFANTTVTYRVGDISSIDDIERLFSSLETSPDILINNAGYLPQPSLFVEADLGEWWHGFTINVLGTAQVTQSYLRHRRYLHTKKSEPAIVVTLNTIGALSIQVPNLSAYGASKAALARWSELITADVPKTEARFLSVHPGAVETDMSVKSGLSSVFPMTDGKLVGDFIVWLTSHEAAFLAGRFVWANWDITELLKKKDEIVSRDLLKTSLSQ